MNTLDTIVAMLAILKETKRPVVVVFENGAAVDGVVVNYSTVSLLLEIKEINTINTESCCTTGSIQCVKSFVFNQIIKTPAHV